MTSPKSARNTSELTGKMPVRPSSTRTITIDRTFEAPLEDVWALWTTKEGLESWWGPEGFTTKVHEIDVRVGGRLRYAMTAVAPEQVAFLEKAGMPLTTEQRVTYQDVVSHRRLAYTSLADFIPGVTPYDLATVVELHPKGQGVRMVLTIDALHDERWTKMAVMGWESQLGKLAKVIAEHQHRAGR
jgi:uncharacterized protein YndB with AHSA1/START domain